MQNESKTWDITFAIFSNLLIEFCVIHLLYVVWKIIVVVYGVCSKWLLLAGIEFSLHPVKDVYLFSSFLLYILTGHYLQPINYAC